MVAYVPFYCDRWLGGTRVLSLEERGAFADWIASYGARDGLFPDDINLFAAVWGCNARKARRLRAQLLAKGKLYSEDGLIHQTFAKECVSKVIAKSEVSTNNAFKRWKNHRENNGNGYANADANADQSSMQTHMQSRGNHKEERIDLTNGESQWTTTTADTHPVPATQDHPQDTTTSPSPQPTEDQPDPTSTSSPPGNSQPTTSEQPSNGSQHKRPDQVTREELDAIYAGWTPAGTRKPHP